MNHQTTEARRLLGATTWAIQPEFMSSMLASLELIGKGGAAAEHAVAALEEAKKIEAARRQSISASTGGAVVVLPIYGIITQGSSFWSYYFGGTSTETFTMQLRQALADPNVQAIVLDVNSPGGTVSGVEELAAEIYAGRKKKTIVALSNTLNASAAYYLSSQASKLYVMPSSLTGSIGVYQTHEDDSKFLETVGVKLTLISAGKFKVEGNSYEPLTDEAKAAMQKMTDGYYAMFVKAVARGRGVKVDAVKNGFGEGRLLMAADAIAQGLADDYATLDAVLEQFGVARPADPNASFRAPGEAPAAAIFQASDQKTKRVDGEDLAKSAFAYRPTDKTEDWKLPIKFSTDEKTKSHIRNAISRWNSTDMPDADEKSKARDRIKAAAKEHDIEIEDGSLALVIEPGPAAAVESRKKPAADELDDNDDGTEDDDGNDDNVCKCKCEACVEGKHVDCTAEAKCAAHAKAAAEHNDLVARERQRIHIALNL